MSRKIGENLRNELKINDPISGSIITLYYRIPMSEERAAYTSALYEREGERLRFTISEARQEFGLKILLGFKEGSFEKEKEGKFVKFSSDTKSPEYDPDWKDLVQKYASDILEALAAHVFEGMRTISSQGEVFTEKN